MDSRRKARTAAAAGIVGACLAAGGCQARGETGARALPTPVQGHPLAAVPIYQLLVASPAGSPAPGPAAGTQILPSDDGRSVVALSATPTTELNVVSAAVREVQGRWRVELQTVDDPTMVVAAATGHTFGVVADGKEIPVGTRTTEQGQILGYVAFFSADAAAALKAARTWTSSVLVTRS